MNTGSFKIIRDTAAADSELDNKWGPIHSLISIKNLVGIISSGLEETLILEIIFRSSGREIGVKILRVSR